jgi:hypothetical protein
MKIMDLIVHASVHTSRLGKLQQANAVAAAKNMPVARLAQLRVARFFIRNMMPFSVCEDQAYREQASTDWKACSRDTMSGTIGECFLVAASEITLVILSTLKRCILAAFHLNADLWTSKVSHFALASYAHVLWGPYLAEASVHAPHHVKAWK